MLESFVRDAGAAVRTVLENGDEITLMIAVVSVLLASLKMDRSGEIVWATLAALALFAVGGYIYDYVRAAPMKDVSDGGRLLDQLRYSWNTFIGLGVGPLIVHVAGFAAAILVLFGVRSLFGRG